MTCTFVGNFTGAPGDTETDVAEIDAIDENGNPVDDTDDAVVEIIAPVPVIQIVKTVAPGSLPAPGGDFTFTLVISNPGPTDLTLDTLIDSVYGDLFDSANPNVTNNTCDDLEGDLLASTNPDSSVSCTFVGNFTGVSGDFETDIAEIDATDEFGTPVDDTDDAVVVLGPAPVIEIVKTVAPGQQPAPGGDFTFTLVITNPGPTDLTLTTLVDSVYGDLFDSANPDVSNNNCDDLEGDVLASANPDASVTCTFVGNFTGVPGDTETDVAEIDAVDENGIPTDDTDDAVVELVAPAPEVQIVKTVAPGSRPAPGGAFTFTLVISNPGPTDLTLTTLVDSVYGDLFDSANPNVTDNTCDDLDGDVLASANPDATVTCTFVGNFTGAAGDTETDTAEIDAIDEFGTPVDDTDDATVELEPAPVVEIVKTVAPGTRPAPGGDFTFTLVITNPGATDLTLDTLVDSVYGDLFDAANPNVTNNNCDDLEGDVLASADPDASVTCTFVGNFTGAAGDTETDTAEIDATDENGNPADDTDDAVVELTDEPVPLVEVVKTVAPGSLPEPGGVFTFTWW